MFNILILVTISFFTSCARKNYQSVKMIDKSDYIINQISSFEKKNHKTINFLLNFNDFSKIEKLYDGNKNAIYGLNYHKSYTQHPEFNIKRYYSNKFFKISSIINIVNKKLLKKKDLIKYMLKNIDKRYYYILTAHNSIIRNINNSKSFNICDHKYDDFLLSINSLNYDSYDQDNHPIIRDRDNKYHNLTPGQVIVKEMFKMFIESIKYNENNVINTTPSYQKNIELFKYQYETYKKMIESVYETLSDGEINSYLKMYRDILEKILKNIYGYKQEKIKNTIDFTKIRNFIKNIAEEYNNDESIALVYTNNLFVNKNYKIDTKRLDIENIEKIISNYYKILDPVDIIPLKIFKFLNFKIYKKYEKKIDICTEVKKICVTSSLPKHISGIIADIVHQNNFKLSPADDDSTDNEILSYRDEVFLGMDGLYSLITSLATSLNVLENLALSANDKLLYGNKKHISILHSLIKDCFEGLDVKSFGNVYRKKIIDNCILNNKLMKNYDVEYINIQTDGDLNNVLKNEMAIIKVDWIKQLKCNSNFEDKLLDQNFIVVYNHKKIQDHYVLESNNPLTNYPIILTNGEKRYGQDLILEKHKKYKYQISGEGFFHGYTRIPIVKEGIILKRKKKD
jgi:hypothetical protein